MMADPRGFEDILASLEQQYLPLDGNPENALLKCVASALTARPDILRTLLDTSSMGIVLTDLEGRIAFANTEYHRLLQYPEGDLSGKFCWDIWTEERERKLFRQFYQGIIENQPPPEPYTVIRQARAGTELNLNISWDYLRDADGRVQGLYNIVHDAAEKLRIQREQKQVETHHRTLFEYAPVALWEEDYSAVRAWIFGLKGSGIPDLKEYLLSSPGQLVDGLTRAHVVRVNRAALELFEVEDAGAFVLSVGRFFRHDARRELVQSLLHFEQADPGFAFECSIRTRKGRTKRILVNQTFMHADESRVLVSAQEITAHVEYRERLAASEKRYRMLFACAPIPLWEEDHSAVKFHMEELAARKVTDLRGYFEAHRDDVARCAAGIRVRDVNGSAQELYEADSREELRQGMGRLLTEESWAIFVDAMVRIAKGESRFTFESSAQTLKGRRLDVLVHYQAMDPVQYSRVLVAVLDITESKHTERLLRISEENSRELFRNAGDMIFELAPDGTINTLNPACEKVTGHPAAPLLGTPLTGLVHPDDRARVEETLRRVVYEGSAMNSEMRFRTADGKFRNAEFNLCRRSGAGNRVSIVGIGRDATERKNDEQRLRIQAQIVDQLHDAVIQTSLEGIISHWNKGAERLFGYTAAETIGRSVLELFRVDGRPEAHRARIIAPVLERGSHKVELWTQRKNGEAVCVHLSLSVITGPSGEPTGLVGFAMDITARKEAVRKLEKVSRRYRALVEMTNDWVWEVDRAGVYTYAGPQVRRILGYEPEEVLGKRPFDFMPPEEASRVASLFEGIVREGRPFQILLNVNLHRNGRLVVLETSGVPFFADDGSLRGFRGVDRDVTDRLRLQEETQKSRNLESLGILAGGIAHDFNNLLTGVFGNIELAMFHLDPGGSPYRHLKTACRAAETAKCLTGQLLTFAKGGIPVREILSIGEIAVTSARTVFNGTHVTWESDLEDGLWKCYVDPRQFRDIFDRLFTNASEALPGGGHVRITGRNRQLGEGERPAVRAGSYVEITVEDTGAGITPENVGRVFDPYFTTKNMGTTKGLGLGLSLCYSIIRKHGGDIGVESKAGKGTRVHLCPPKGPENLRVSGPSPKGLAKQDPP